MLRRYHGGAQHAVIILGAVVFAFASTTLAASECSRRHGTASRPRQPRYDRRAAGTVPVPDVASIVQWPCRKPDIPIDRRCYRVVCGYGCRWESVTCQTATVRRLGCELRGTYCDGQGMKATEQRTRKMLPCQCRRMRTGRWHRCKDLALVGTDTVNRRSTD